MPELEGRLVRLREKSLEDAANDYAWRTDPELAELDASPPLKLSFSEYFLIFVQQLRYPPPLQHSFAIETKEGSHIGNCVYYGMEEQGEVEVGIMIGERAYWNQGYGSDVITTLLDYLFTQTSVERAFLCTLDGNLRAQRCFARCGFVPCGRLIKEGRHFVMMDIRRPAWLYRISLREKNTSPKESVPGN